MSKVNDTYEEAPMTQEEMQNEVAINENELLKALTSERVSQRYEDHRSVLQRHRFPFPDSSPERARMG